MSPSSVLSFLAVMFLCSLIGCGGSGNSNTSSTTVSGSGLASGGATSEYVLLAGTGTNTFGISTVQRYPVGANGTVSPTSTLSLPSGFAPLSMALDTTGNIYVGGYYSNSTAEILTYPAGASGSPTPSSILNVASFPNSLVVSNGNLYCMVGAPTQGAISVYPITANGLAAPIRSLYQGEFYSVQTSAFVPDKAGDIYFAGANANYTSTSIWEIAASVNGPAYANMNQTFSAGVQAMTLDADGNLYLSQTSGQAGQINVYPGLSSTAMRTINLPTVPESISLDAADNLYAAYGSSSGLILLALSPTSGTTVTDQATASQTGEILAIAVH